MSQQSQVGGQDEPTFAQPLYTPIKRRSFFMYAGATAGATALVLAGCSKDDTTGGSGTGPTTGPIKVGTSDIGVLNYAYALEQLEAGFYTAVRGGSYYSALAANSAEKQILDDLYYHEVIHREFFKAAIPAASRISDALKPDFSKIDFTSRTSVLGTAKAFEDLGVSAYNGAGKFITNATYLVLAGKIVSVEARHAAIIRDLVSEGTFVGSDVINLSGANDNGGVSPLSTEISKLPSVVVATANTFLMADSRLDVSGLG